MIRKATALILVVILLTSCSNNEKQNVDSQPIANHEQISHYLKQIENLKIENGKLKMENLKLKEQVRELERRLLPRQTNQGG